MTKITNNPLLQGLSGMLGDVVVYRKIRGNMVMANKPSKTSKVSDSQVAVRDRFREASAYAREATADPEAKAEYQSVVGDRVGSAYEAALTDYLRAPVIKNVDLSQYTGKVGDPIMIKAVDDFKVVSVLLRIVAADGTLVETGEAVSVKYSSFLWSYSATAANANLTGTKVTVTVRDKATNITVSESAIS